jgi:hypothetical protein
VVRSTFLGSGTLLSDTNLFATKSWVQSQGYITTEGSGDISAVTVSGGLLTGGGTNGAVTVTLSTNAVRAATAAAYEAAGSVTAHNTNAAAHAGLFDAAGSAAAVSNALAAGAAAGLTALQDFSTLTGADVAAAGGLTNAAAFATAAQGSTADSAVQPTDPTYTQTVALAAGAVQVEADTLQTVADRGGTASNVTSITVTSPTVGNVALFNGGMVLTKTQTNIANGVFFNAAYGAFTNDTLFAIGQDYSMEELFIWSDILNAGTGGDFFRATRSGKVMFGRAASPVEKAALFTIRGTTDSDYAGLFNIAPSNTAAETSTPSLFYVQNDGKVFVPNGAVPAFSYSLGWPSRTFNVNGDIGYVGTIFCPSGSESGPSIASSVSPTTGLAFNWGGSNRVAVILNGAAAGYFSSSGLIMASGLSVLGTGQFGSSSTYGRLRPDYPASGDVSVSVGASAATYPVTFKAAGNVGIGTNTPTATFHVYAATNAPAFQINSPNTWPANAYIEAVYRGATLLRYLDEDGDAYFLGTSLQVRNGVAGGAYTDISQGAIVCRTAIPYVNLQDGSAGEDDWTWSVNGDETYWTQSLNDTTATERMRLGSGGGLFFTPANGTNMVAAKNGYAGIFAAQTVGSTNDVELWSIDDQGNVTLQTSHDGLTAVHRSHNRYTGKGRVMDLDAMGAAITALATAADWKQARAAIVVAGGTNIYTTYSVPAVDWDVEQAAEVAKSEAAISAWMSDTNAPDVKGEKPALKIAKPKPTWLVDALKPGAGVDGKPK